MRSSAQHQVVDFDATIRIDGPLPIRGSGPSDEVAELIARHCYDAALARMADTPTLGPRREALRQHALAWSGDETAIPRLRELVERAEASGAWLDAADATTRLALLQLRARCTGEALVLARRAVAESSGSRSAEEVEARRVLGLALVTTGRFPDGRAQYEIALQLTHDTDPARRRIELALVAAYLNEGMTELAELRARRALATAETAGDQAAIATAHGYLGIIDTLLGRPESALEHIELDRALTAESGASSLNQVNAINLARVLRQLNRVSEARAVAERCAKQFDHCADRSNHALARIELALARCKGAGFDAQAELRALRRLSGDSDVRVDGVRLLAEAIVSTRLPDLAEAELSFASARDAWSRGGAVSAWLLDAHLQFGAALEAAGARERALHYLHAGYKLARSSGTGELARRLLGAIDALDETSVAASEVVVARCEPPELNATATDAIIGQSPAMHRLRMLAAKAAECDITALILGESGTGKELVATAIHRQSRRGSRPPVVVNCAAFAETLVESELFGHVKGAFSHAISERTGAFERANGSTLFLDEVGELSLQVQAKLLRALEQGQVQKVGAGEPVRVDVRIIAATNRDLEQMVAEGTFRSDLYHRLNKITLCTVPLREHADDLELMVAHLLSRNPLFKERGIISVSRGAVERLRGYPFPGNVRELDNILVSAAMRTDSAVISSSHLPLLKSSSGRARSATTGTAGSGLDVSLDELLTDGFQLDEFQQRLIRRAIALSGGNKAAAARLLGISRRRIYSLLKGS